MCSNDQNAKPGKGLTPEDYARGAGIPPSPSSTSRLDMLLIGMLLGMGLAALGLAIGAAVGGSGLV